MGHTKNTYRIFVKKHEGQRPFERSQYIKEIIIIDFKGVS
jgi:hypothetical protein